MIYIDILHESSEEEDNPRVYSEKSLDGFFSNRIKHLSNGYWYTDQGNINKVSHDLFKYTTKDNRLIRDASYV